jgi:hypothetical protein
MDPATTAAPAIKGSIPECLDAMSRHADGRALLKQLQEGIEALRGKDFEGLADAFAKNLYTPIYRDPKRSRALTAYLTKYWFDQSSPAAYFPDLQPIAPMYAEGILTTITLSLRGRGKPTPIDGWWVINHQGFQMINLVSKQQITLLIATPRPITFKDKAAPQLGETEVWTTRRSRVESSVPPKAGVALFASADPLRCVHSGSEQAARSLPFACDFG